MTLQLPTKLNQQLSGFAGETGGELGVRLLTTGLTLAGGRVWGRHWLSMTGCVCPTALRTCVR
jgi:hypothetical protein